MSLPALLAYGSPVTILTKNKLRGFWELLPFVESIAVLDEGLAGVRKAAVDVRLKHVQRSVTFTNSFRSGLVPWLARVPVRAGAKGHWRRGLLTNVITLDDLEQRHQSQEYFRLLGLPEPKSIPSRVIELTGDIDGVRAAFGIPASVPLIAMIPGAARGVSKQWPADRFRESLRRILDGHSHDVVLLGSESERELCEQVGTGFGSRVHVLAGKTSLRQMAELLSVAETAVVNDSGGMHLAAAVGRSVVAIFGITDSDKTGPMGSGHEILAAPGYMRGRDLPRNSELATEALAQISVDEVVSAVDRVLERGRTQLTSQRVGGK